MTRAWRLTESDRNHGGYRAWKRRCAEGPDQSNLEAAAAQAGDGATGAGRNDFKIELARRAVLRALRTVVDQESL